LSSVVALSIDFHTISPPGNNSFLKDLSFTGDVLFFLFQREISEMRRPIGAKVCMAVSTRPNFIMPIQNFRGPPKNFRG